MKMKLHPLSSLALAVASLPCHALNPIIQTIYTADPAPMVYKDTLYLYTGHDEDKSTSKFVMKDWRCFSSTDMVNWTDHGSPLSLNDFSWAKSDAWAGQCIERNGKFYYYVPVTPKQGNGVIGVAVSDSPTGPFHDALGHPLVTTGMGDIDPTVCIDDDGQAYLYWGNPHLFYIKLNKDMISFDTTIGNKGVTEVLLTVEGFGKGNGRSWLPRVSLYEEGPWFQKRNGLYYMAYAAGGIPENICYATSANATGPWTFKGVIMPTQGHCFTNQTGIVDYKGHSYFFYHDCALPGGGGFDRSVCLEEFKYNPDGTFPTISMTDKGPDPLGHLNPYVQTPAATIAWESGIKTTKADQGDVYVTPSGKGSYIRVCSVDFGAQGASRFSAHVASATAGAAIELHLDSENGPLVGTLHLGPEVGPCKGNDASCAVRGAQGAHDLYLNFTGDGSPSMKFDWWKFE